MFNFVGWFIEGTNKYCINLLFGHYKIAENGTIMVILFRPLQRNVIQLIFRASFAGCCRPFALEVECGAQVWKNCWMAELFQLLLLLLLLLLLWWWWWWWFCLFYDLCVFFSICSWTSECTWVLLGPWSVTAKPHPRRNHLHSRWVNHSDRAGFKRWGPISWIRVVARQQGEWFVMLFWCFFYKRCK